MPKFVFAYHGGPREMSAEAGRDHMQRWMAWMGELGDAVIDRGLPFGQSVTVTPEGIKEGGGANPLAGYTLVTATDIDDAAAMAQRSPHIAIGGTIEVAAALDMPM